MKLSLPFSVGYWLPDSPSLLQFPMTFGLTGAVWGKENPQLCFVGSNHMCLAFHLSTILFYIAFFPRKIELGIHFANVSEAILENFSEASSCTLKSKLWKNCAPWILIKGQLVCQGSFRNNTHQTFECNLLSPSFSLIYCHQIHCLTEIFFWHHLSSLYQLSESSKKLLLTLDNPNSLQVPRYYQHWGEKNATFIK